MIRAKASADHTSASAAVYGGATPRSRSASFFHNGCPVWRARAGRGCALIIQPSRGQRSSPNTGSGKVPALCSSTRHLVRPTPISDQAQFASGPSIPHKSSGIPSSRAMPTEADRGAMTDHYREPVVGEAGGHALQGGAHPLAHRFGRLTLWRRPRPVRLGVALPDLPVCQPLPDSARTLSQVLVRRHGQPGDPAERRRRPGRTAQVRRYDHVRLKRGEQPRRAFGLPLAGLVKRDVALALEPFLHVPGGLPVPPQNQPSRAQRGPPASLVSPAATGSGTGIRGQSFHSRSSA